jgi:hypothetical protein
MASDTAFGAEYGTLETFVVPEGPGDMDLVVFATIRPPRVVRPPALVTGRRQLGLLRAWFAQGGKVFELPGTAL